MINAGKAGGSHWGPEKNTEKAPNAGVRVGDSLTVKLHLILGRNSSFRLKFYTLINFVLVALF